jgi:TDG/mug DNA glycosylase family protein
MESIDEKPDSPNDQKSDPLGFSRLDLTQFAYSPKISASLMDMIPLRPSPRKSFARTGDILRTQSDTLDNTSEITSGQRSPKKLKRTYAAPETYAHLNGLHDWLKEQLDGRVFIF